VNLSELSCVSPGRSPLADRTFLGEVEHLVLAASLRLGKKAYGAAIMEEIESCTGRRVQAGTVYVTVQRLEEKSLVSCSIGQPEEGRGGRPKRFVKVSPAGLRALADHRNAVLKIWDGLEGRLKESG